MQNIFVFSSDFTKEFVVVLEAFVDRATSFLYCESELDVRYTGLLALWWLAGWCLVK
jgi:hypothetical protein